MPKKLNKARLKAFIARRKINALGLSMITAASVLITLICALTGFKHTDILVIVSVLLVLLCFVQAIKFRKTYRTIPSFKGSLKKKPKHS